MRRAISAYVGPYRVTDLSGSLGARPGQCRQQAFFRLGNIGQFGADLVRPRLLSIDLVERPRRRALERHQVGNQLRDAGAVIVGPCRGADRHTAAFEVAA